MTPRLVVARLVPMVVGARSRGTGSGASVGGPHPVFRWLADDRDSEPGEGV